jgi:hypothetical protein
LLLEIQIERYDWNDLQILVSLDLPQSLQPVSFGQLEIQTTRRSSVAAPTDRGKSGDKRRIVGVYPLVLAERNENEQLCGGTDRGAGFPSVIRADGISGNSWQAIRVSRATTIFNSSSDPFLRLPKRGHLDVHAAIRSTTDSRCSGDKCAHRAAMATVLCPAPP